MNWSTWISTLRLVTFAQIRSKLPNCGNQSAAFFCEQENLLGGHFWAMGRFNLLGGQSNLLFTSLQVVANI